MFKKSNKKSKLAIMAAALLLVLSVLSFIPASGATTHKMVTITTNTDINPFIRVALHNRTFSSGGPFTIRCEVNVQQFQKTAIDGNVFYNIADGRDPNQMVVWVNHFSSKTNGWIEMKDYNGQYITFNNIDRVLISGVFEPFGLFQFGVYKAKAVVSYRNFRILDAAGNVVYSWDTDPSFQNLTNLKEYEGDTVFTLTFGDGSARYDVTDSEDGSQPSATTTTENFYINPTTTTKKTQETTTKAASAAEITTTEAEPTDTDTSDYYIDPTQDEKTETSTSENDSPQPTEDTEGKGGDGKTALIIGLIIAGVIIVGGGTAFLVLLKMNKLPWFKKQ
ncbi:MAG TPA: hypothetical protein PK687_05285 [Candidatus Avimonas sp.]|nr:hypothetical protein [Candidatus Avimonas sp.]